MKAILFGLAVLASGTGSALADDCQDRFTALYLELDQELATKTLVTTEMKGAPPMTNEFYYLNAGHHMTVPISPPMPRVLTHDNVMYQSADQGQTWAKVRDLDAAQNAEGALAAKQENAKTIRNAECGEAEVNGETVDVLSADLTVSQGMVTENRYTYYVRRSDGFIVKAIYDTKAPNFEMLVTQEIEKSAGLSLPTPAAQ